ncbi:hypothetical protein GOODEAATRI_006459 [Goodea atripinnis]|uniref:BEN domain-containing protein n=1 Tax=Goodea atripinnis TaxID=208336 RepID=A0ABV0PLI0_9TELE
MKISDRLQLENLHSTLMNSAPGLSNPSPPPLVNGTHKDDGQKVVQQLVNERLKILELTIFEKHFQELRDRTPALSVKKEKEEMEIGEEKEPDMARHTAMARKLAEYSEGRCRADVKLRTISSQLERVLYHNCQRSSGNPRPDRYASYIFRYLVPYDIYCDWVAKVNYVGLMGKEALPRNLRRTIRMYLDRRFPFLSTDRWREIRDAINEILRVKRRPDFFREYDDSAPVLF